jgi:hypothetical protein
MLAGHETTASTLTWALYELSRHLEVQIELREEIKTMRAQAARRGNGELSVADLDSMKCLLALMKVRPYGAFDRIWMLTQIRHWAYRRHSDTIPLSTPSFVSQIAMI